MKWNLRAAITAAVSLLLNAGCISILKTDYNNIQYLCCDWGPAMTSPGQTGTATQGNNTEDEIYFLKQIGLFSRKNNPSDGRAQDTSKGLSIWLCTMRADGSGKTEIKELWKNPDYPIHGITRMNLNRKTRTIVFSITSSGSDLTGMWTVNLDGSELKHLIVPGAVAGHPQHIYDPSWTPDGEHIFYCEETDNKHLMRCTRNGGSSMRFKGDGSNSQPDVSPDGTQVLYTVRNPKMPVVWLMDADGSRARPFPNPLSPAHRHLGDSPVWSSDGKYILVSCMEVIDAATGTHIPFGPPRKGEARFAGGGINWGKAGVIGHNPKGIFFVDMGVRVPKYLSASRVVECSGKADADRW